MLDNKQKTFLKLITLIATKYYAKGVVNGVVTTYNHLTSTVISRSEAKEELMDYKNYDPVEAVEIELETMAGVLGLQELQQKEADLILENTVAKTKVEVLTEITSILNDDEINTNIEQADIEDILDDPNIKVKVAKTDEEKETIIKEVAQKTGQSVEKVKQDIQEQRPKDNTPFVQIHDLSKTKTNGTSNSKPFYVDGNTNENDIELNMIQDAFNEASSTNNVIDFSQAIQKIASKKKGTIQ
jgi:hypothetical protein